MSVKMVEEGTPKFHPSIKAMKKLAKTVRINYLELWKITKGLQQPREHLDKKMILVSVGTVDFVAC